MRRKQPLTDFEKRRLEKRRDLAAFIAETLPDDRAEWVRIVAAGFGTEAGKFADAVYPDRPALAHALSNEIIEIHFRLADDGADRPAQTV